MPATAETANKPPPATVVEAIRRHHEDEHGLAFDLSRDIYFPGNTPDGTTYDVSSDPARGDKFMCAICGPGTNFLVGELPYGTPQRNALLQLTDRNLQTLLTGTHGEDREALTEAYDRGELGPLLLAGTAARKRRQVATRNSPAYQRRLAGFRTYFLDAYAREGSVERAIQSLVALYESDRDAYTRVVGTSRPFSEETFRKYVPKVTSDAERTEAKSRWHATQNQRLAKRRSGR